MKFLLLYFIVLLIHVNSDNVKVLNEIVKDSCKDVAKIDQTLIDQAMNGHFFDDKKLKAYYFCYGVKMGYIVMEDRGPNRYGKDTETVDPNALGDWLKKLQHDPITIDGLLWSCVSKKMLFDVDSTDVLQLTKCLSEKGVPVDVVSANYIDHSIEDFNTLSEKCKSEFPVDQNLIDEAQKGNVADSESLGVYYTCYLMGTDLLDWYLNISYSGLKIWFKFMLNHKSDKVDSAVDRCYKSKVGEETLEEDVLQIVKCFADEKLPVDVVTNQ